MNMLINRNKKLVKVKVVTMDADLNSITIEVLLVYIKGTSVEKEIKWEKRNPFSGNF